MSKVLEALKFSEIWAVDIESSVVKGRILHGAGNLGQSGAFLEKEFRDHFSKRFHEPIVVGEGYFVKPDGQVSNQTDMMLYDNRLSIDTHETISGSRYISHQGVYGIVEIKTSSDQIGKAFEHVDLLINQHQEQAMLMPKLKKPLSMVAVADSSGLDASSIVDVYQSASESGRHIPDYLVLIDRACIVAGSPGLDLQPYLSPEVRLPSKTLRIGQKLKSVNWGFWVPSNNFLARGRVLRWLLHQVYQDVYDKAYSMTQITYSADLNSNSDPVLSMAVDTLAKDLSVPYSTSIAMQGLFNKISFDSGITWFGEIAKSTLPDIKNFSII